MSSLYRGAGQVKTVAVLGAGVIGSGWIATFLAAGLRVRVFDLGADVPAQVDAWVKSAWPRMQELGLVRPGADPSAVSFHSTLRETLGRLAPGTPLRDGLERILRGKTGALIVLGYDDSQFARLSYIRLSSISQDAQLLASAAVDRAIDRLEGATPAAHLVRTPHLVLRNTTGPAQAD